VPGWFYVPLLCFSSPQTGQSAKNGTFFLSQAPLAPEPEIAN
jgi:hypothetical protein